VYYNHYTNGATMIDPRALLAKLDLTEAEIEVYLAMLGGALAARDIVKVSGRSRPTVYYALTALERRGLLSKTGLEGEQRFKVEPLQRLITIAEEKQSELKQVRSDLGQFVAQKGTSGAGDNKPHVSFYEGTAGVRNVIMESLYCHKRHIDSIVPTQNFFWQLGSDFVDHYVATRHNLGLSTRNLWGVTIEQQIINRYYQKSEIRMMPSGLGNRFRTTIFLYDDKVLYVSSLASGYALLVSSTEHAEMMQALYESVWKQSKPLSPPVSK
jgi:sugar-specific transcriptional regulator TrmB